jgi:Inner membrane component of T3SS, cytoplasmic domain
MAPLGYVEVVDAKGNVTERVRVDSLPIHVGRAYSNHIVIHDPYVCPVHLAIERDEDDRLIARDLDSVNGLCNAINGDRVPVLELHSGTQFRIGHTLLRFCSVDHPLAPTLIDRERKESWVPSSYAASIAGIIILLLLCLDSFLSSIERVTVARVVSEPLMSLAMLVGWAGLWALASRVVVSRFHFAQHVTIACCALFGFLVLSTSSEWLEFFFPVIPALWIAGFLGSGLILAGLVYGHLGWASTMRRRSRLWASLLVSGAAIGLSLIIDFANRSKFSNVMEYTGIVKPIDAAWLPSTSVNQFMENTGKLKKELDLLAQKARSTQP